MTMTMEEKMAERLAAVEAECRALREIEAERAYAAQICEMLRREVKMRGGVCHEAWFNAWRLYCTAKTPFVKEAAQKAVEKFQAANQAAYEALKELRRAAEA